MIKIQANEVLYLKGLGASDEVVRAILNLSASRLRDIKRYCNSILTVDKDLALQGISRNVSKKAMKINRYGGHDYDNSGEPTENVDDINIICEFSESDI